MNVFKFYFFVILLFSSFTLMNAQKNVNSQLTYKEIEQKIDSLHGNPKLMWNMINFYIQKSKQEKNLESLFYAYRYASSFSEYPNNYKYADSALTVAQKSNNKKLISNAYINHGNVEMGQSKYQNAIDDILVAKKYADEIKNEYIIYKSKYLIAQNKIYLGLYEDAIKELEECIVFFKKNLNNQSLGKDYQTYYVYSLMSIIDSNSKIGNFQPNDELLNEAFNYLEQHDLKIFIPYFISSEGIYAYYKKDYRKAISKLTEALKLYNDQWSHISEIYYTGLSYWKMGKHNIAIKYFEQIDKEYNKENKLEPEFRSAYELLIKYNDSIGNRDKQLKYINKLMILDNSYQKNYKYLYDKINKEYDAKELIAEKTRIENSLKTRNYIILSLILLTITIISFLGYRYYTLQKKYELIFKKLVSENPFNNNLVDEKLTNSNNFEVKSLENYSIPKNSIAITNPQTDFYQKIPGMNPTLVESILNQLQEFEKEEGFLNPQVSQKLLSENFGTNSTYLSKIINVYKGKNFNTYINDLKLDYILNLLKTDRKYLNKDVKELSQISGFLNPENFSDNFQRKFKIKPSYFIKKMKENIEINDIEN